MNKNMNNLSVNKTINLLINKYRKKDNKFAYPLLDDAFSNEDLSKGIRVILSGQLTMSKETKKFESFFAKKIKTKYAVMVNSGSSANLLATFASCNPLRKKKFKKGDEVLIPALCWSTSLWPLVQSGLKPKFVDVDPFTLNVNAKDLLKKINKKTKVIMLIHALGNSTDIDIISNHAKKKNIILIEDTCESLGSKYKGKSLGTFGDFGTYSFYYSHQISSGEGGMIVCNNRADYDLLLSLRSHGWTRNLSNRKQIEKRYPKLDNRFIFANSGFNLRPTDISASIGLSQFLRLTKFKNIRAKNRKKIISALKNSKKWNNQYEFFNINENINPSFFGFPIFLTKKYSHKKFQLINHLSKRGVENRPIISGNFLNQPSAKLYKFKQQAKDFPGAQIVQERGFFIGLHAKPISKFQIDLIVKSLLSL